MTGYHEQRGKYVASERAKARKESYWSRFGGWTSVFLILVVIVIALAVFLASGCKFAQSSSSAPSAKATYKETTEQLDDKGKPIKRVTVEKTGEATGTSAKAIGDKLDQKTTAQPASVGVDGVQASGGGGSSDTKAKGSESLFANPLIYVGIMCLLLAGVAVWQGWKGMIIPAAASGVVFLACAFYPWLLIWGVVAVVGIVGGPYIYEQWKAQRSSEALRAVVAGIAGLPKETQEAVKEEVGKQADRRDEDTITRIKRKDGLE